jgi:hypothetical protein
MRLPVVLLSVLALAASGAADASAQGKGKNKDKSKGKSEQKSDDRKDGRHDGRHDGHHDGDRDGKMTICHVPPGNPSARHTITVGDSAWKAHQAHGDHRGACGSASPHPSPYPGGRFDALDTNDDGVISRDEWRGNRATFDRLDRNDNGVISRDEFHRN